MKALQTLTVWTAVLTAGAAIASERKVKMEDLPAAVQDTLRERTKDMEVLALSEEIEHGETVYEAEVRVEGKTREIVVDPRGKVVEEEMEVPLSSIPEAARAAIEGIAGEGKVKKVEAVTKDGVTLYEAKIKKDGKKSEIVVDAEGEVQKKN